MSVTDELRKHSASTLSVWLLEKGSSLGFGRWISLLSSFFGTVVALAQLRGLSHRIRPAHSVISQKRLTIYKIFGCHIRWDVQRSNVSDLIGSSDGSVSDGGEKSSLPQNESCCSGSLAPPGPRTALPPRGTMWVLLAGHGSSHYLPHTHTIVGHILSSPGSSRDGQRLSSSLGWSLVPFLCRFATVFTKRPNRK